jgi:PTH1 family peptidyl-tRNA hydrolase
MLLFVGLGNPGDRYVGNRHNIGFMAVQAIAKRHGMFSRHRDFQGIVAETKLGYERVVMLWPGTLMNGSGLSVAEAKRFYKLSLSQIVVFHDELEIPFGTVRVKKGGGNAGHNGLRSISEHVGNDYRRVRLGIGHPGDKSLVERYVLHDFAKAERPWVNALCRIVADSAVLLTEKEDVGFEQRVNVEMHASGFFADEGKF